MGIGYYPKLLSLQRAIHYDGASTMPLFTAKPMDIAAGFVSFPASESHHLTKVLRYRSGDSVQVTDGQGHLYEGVIAETQPQAIIKILKQLPDPPSPFPVHLFVSLLKRENLELIVQKAVELNIAAIHFIQTSHSVRTELSANKWERFQRIAEEAYKQCGRVYPLTLHEPVSFAALLKNLPEGTHFAFIEREEQASLKKLFSEGNLKQPYGLWIGPEGGWHVDEITAMKQAGFKPATLGPLILRAETAALHATSSVIALL